MSLNLVLPINKINLDNIICFQKQKNNIMQNSDFYKLIYSDEYSILNGVFFSLLFKDIFIEKYFNKIKCTISKTQFNKVIIKNIYETEKNILLKFKNYFQKYKPVYRIFEQLNNYNIKLQSSKIQKYTTYKVVKFFIKISGIWCSHENKTYGLTFKFFNENERI